MCRRLSTAPDTGPPRARQSKPRPTCVSILQQEITSQRTEVAPRGCPGPHPGIWSSLETRQCVVSAQTRSHVPWEGSVCQSLSCFANEFNESKSFHAIPRPVSTCQLLTSSGALVSSGDQRDTEANYSIWLPLLQPRPCQASGDLSQAPSMLAKFSSLGNHQELPCNEAFLRHKKTRLLLGADLIWGGWNSHLVSAGEHRPAGPWSRTG